MSTIRTAIPQHADALLPPEVNEQLQKMYRYLRIQPYPDRVWTRVFSESERKQVESELAARPEEPVHPAQIYARIRHLSLGRAVAELGYAVELVARPTYEWISRELAQIETPAGPPLSPVDADVGYAADIIEDAVRATALVVVDAVSCRRVFWRGREFRANWSRREVQWQFFTALVQRAARGLGLDASHLTGRLDAGAMKDRKYHLKKARLIPEELHARIRPEGGHSYKLALLPHEIAYVGCFDSVSNQWLLEAELASRRIS